MDEQGNKNLSEENNQSSFTDDPFQNTQSTNQQPVYVIPDMKKDDKKGLGIASLVLGILSIVCCCINYVPAVFAGLGLIFAIFSLKANKSGIALAGLITSIVGLVFGVVSIFTSILMQDVYQEYYDEIMKYLEEYLNGVEGEPTPVEFIGNFIKSLIK